MTNVDKALAYAQTHLQAVRIVWVDRTPTVCNALDAVVLCSDRLVSRCIVAAVAQDKTFEAMLNRLIDID